MRAAGMYSMMYPFFRSTKSYLSMYVCMKPQELMYRGVAVHRQQQQLLLYYRFDLLKVAETSATKE